MSDDIQSEIHENRISPTPEIVPQEVTDNMKKFFEEYKALCDEHGCFLLSEGEEVWLVEDKKEMDVTRYWYVEESTYDRAKRGRL